MLKPGRKAKRMSAVRLGLGTVETTLEALFRIT
jgi:hypothetical protein